MLVITILGLIFSNKVKKVDRMQIFIFEKKVKKY